MQNIQISVIVPVYNAEPYLRDSIDSILKQNFNEFELIIVDDGSTDNSLSILREYEQQDERVQVFTQSNQYCGAARNNGFSKARGKYVIYWDCDDFFPDNALRALYDEAERTEADICIGEAKEIDGSTGEFRRNVKYINWSMVPSQRPFSIKDIPNEIFRFSNSYVWNKLYRREFLAENGISFPTIKRAEDKAFVYASLVKAERISVVNEVIVHFYLKPANNRVNVNRVLTQIEGYELFIEYLKGEQLWEIENIRNSILRRMFSSMKMTLMQIEDTNDLDEVVSCYQKYTSQYCYGEYIYDELSDSDRALLHAIDCNDVKSVLFEMFSYYKVQSSRYYVKSENYKARFEHAQEILEIVREKLRVSRDKTKEQKQIVAEQQELLERKLVQRAIKLSNHKK